MATERLYYSDSYLTDFSARVLKCEPADGAWRVLLDASAFYPTSGGQPYDTGFLGAARVEDVTVNSAGEVWHTVDQPLPEGSEVRGRIDWERRFDHMQQHAGEHMIAGAIHRLLNGHTIGLHLGHDASSIDVDLPGGATRVDEESLLLIEDAVNRDIQRNLPIRCWFPDEAELSRLPLRKPPTVREHIRIVMIGDEECVACGGTHPAHTGEIGLVKILDARPSKGKMRVTFVCGQRAVLDYRMRFEAAREAARLLSTEVESLGAAVSHQLEKTKEAERALGALRREQILEKAREAIRSPECLPNGLKAAACVFEGADAFALRDAANEITSAGLIALLSAGTQKGSLLLFAVPPSVPVSAGRLLSETCRVLGGKGGGRPDFAQGAAPGGEALKLALENLAREAAE